MRMPRPQAWTLSLLVVLLPGTWSAGNHLALLYHLTAVSRPAQASPAFWVSGWLGPQQYLSYNSLRPEAQPFGAWAWEIQVPWYWEKETMDLRGKEKLFLDALKALGEKGSFTLQGLLGCELQPDNSTVPTALFALNGEEFMQFDPHNGSWSGEWPETETVSELWKQQEDVARTESKFLLTSCPERLLGHLQRGRDTLDWKEPPSMRLKARPSSKPGFLVLTCTAFSFYPPELQLHFQHNGLAAGSGEGDLGPNGDGSFHAWSSLEVKSGEEYHYRCVVQHGGLAQPLTVGLDSRARTSVPVVVGISLGFLALLVVAAVGVLLWTRMRSGLPAPWLSLSGDDVGDLLPGSGFRPEVDSQDANVLPVTA